MSHLVILLQPLSRTGKFLKSLDFAQERADGLFTFEADSIDPQGALVGFKRAGNFGGDLSIIWIPVNEIVAILGGNEKRGGSEWLMNQPQPTKAVARK